VICYRHAKVHECPVQEPCSFTNSVEEPTIQNTRTLTVCLSDQGYISPGCASDGALWHGLHEGWCNLVITVCWWWRILNTCKYVNIMCCNKGVCSNGSHAVLNSRIGAACEMCDHVGQQGTQHWYDNTVGARQILVTNKLHVTNDTSLNL
jgi:hypothetical protein